MANKTVNTTEETGALYDVELKRIALISERLTSFMKNAVNKYPSTETRKLNMVADLITEIIEKNDTPNYTSKNKVEDVYKLIEEFSPLSVSNNKQVENTFNLDEVLNPKDELDLMSLCKELGVTD